MAITFAYIKMQVKRDPLCLPKIVDLKLGGLFTIRHLFSQDLSFNSNASFLSVFFPGHNQMRDI